MTGDQALEQGMRRLMSEALQHESPTEWLNSLADGLGQKVEDTPDEEGAAFTAGIAVGLVLGERTASVEEPS